MASKTDVIREFIHSEIIGSSNGINLEDTHSLFGSGIIDSLGMMKLLLFLEEKFVIQVTDEDLTPENFESIRTLSLLVEKKMA
jgi:acyl carrier protein